MQKVPARKELFCAMGIWVGIRNEVKGCMLNFMFYHPYNSSANYALVFSAQFERIDISDYPVALFQGMHVIFCFRIV